MAQLEKQRHSGKGITGIEMTYAIWSIIAVTIISGFGIVFGLIIMLKRS